RARDLNVVEVNRPNRQTRRRKGKSDTIDAEMAARAVLARDATVVPKAGDGPIEALRQLRIARRGAMKAHTAAANQLHSLTDTAPGFAALCGSSPVRVSSGKTNRHRLNRAGDRHANAALWTIVMVRIRSKHAPTINYIERRTADGLSTREAIRCLKRYVAREIYWGSPS